MKNKIKVILLAVTILLLGGHLSAKPKIVVKKSGGGKEGYKNVKEEHRRDNHSLICSGQGREACVWGQGIPNVLDNQNLLAIDIIISDRIDAEDYSGTGNLEGSNIWFYWRYNQVTKDLTYTISKDSPDYSLE